MNGLRELVLCLLDPDRRADQAELDFYRTRAKRKPAPQRSPYVMVGESDGSTEYIPSDPGF